MLTQTVLLYENIPDLSLPKTVLASADELGSTATQIIIYFAISHIPDLADKCYLPNALEARSLHWKQNFDVCTARKYAFKVYPSSLNINPHIEQGIYAIQFLLPSEGFLFKHLQ
jgi:hypothetical protein